MDFVEEHRRSGGWVELIGMERLVQISPAETSMRLAPSRLTPVPAPAV